MQSHILVISPVHSCVEFGNTHLFVWTVILVTFSDNPLKAGSTGAKYVKLRRAQPFVHALIELDGPRGTHQTELELYPYTMRKV